MSGENIDSQALKSDIKNFEVTFGNEEEAFSVSTSGSTGEPKIIRIPKVYMRASARTTLKFLELKAGDRALLCLPTNKIAGIMMILRAMEGDLQLEAVSPSANPLAEVAGNFAFAAMVPLQAEASLTELHRVDKLIIGGAPINSQLEAKLRRLPGEIFHTYGMTETISHVAMRRIGSDYFRAVPAVSFQVNADGRLIIDAPHIGIKALLTNDVVDLQDSHTFKWLGRADNVVNSGGVKLHPEDIEKRLGDLGMPYFLTGIPDDRLGQQLVLVLETQAQLSLADFDFSALDPYEKPRALYCLPAFDYTANGKLRRIETLKQL